jgi:hypothetical protein
MGRMAPDISFFRKFSSAHILILNPHCCSSYNRITTSSLLSPAQLFLVSQPFKMPKTLLTGANGFVAAHIASKLIEAGHTVVGSVRTPSKGQQILDTHPEWASSLSFVVVSDYAAPGTWDKTFQDNDFDYVVHTAAPLLDDPRNTDYDRDFFDPSVKG